MPYGDKTVERLIGKTIQKIYLNSVYLKFETDLGNIVFTVDGDCCSHSYFHDFIGVEKLLKGNPVISVNTVELTLEDSPNQVNENDDESIACYGYQLVTEDPALGEVTSVFSFRNSSNGYYGGSLENADDSTVVEPQITNDVLEAVHSAES